MVFYNKLTVYDIVQIIIRDINTYKAILLFYLMLKPILIINVYQYAL
jgi:hypothetical protein